MDRNKDNNTFSSRNSRAITRRRMGPFTFLTLSWNVIFLSLTVDAVVIFLLDSPVIYDPTGTYSILCALLVLPFLNQKGVASYLAVSRTLQRKNHTTIRRFYSHLALIGGVIAVAIKLSGIGSLHPVNALIFCTCILLWAGLLINHHWRIQRAKLHQTNDYRYESILLWERQVVYLNLFPLLMARGISFFAILATNFALLSLPSYGYILGSALFLLLLKPKQEFYLGACPNCQRTVPIAFVSYQSCPSCDTNLAKQLFGEA